LLLVLALCGQMKGVSRFVLRGRKT